MLVVVPVLHDAFHQILILSDRSIGAVLILQRQVTQICRHREVTSLLFANRGE